MMQIEYRTFEIENNQKVEPFQANPPIERDQEEANSLGEFIRVGLTAFFLMTGLSAAVYFFLFFLVSFGLSQFGQ